MSNTCVTKSIFFFSSKVSDDLDGVPMYSTPSVSTRTKQGIKTTPSKWEMDAPILSSSKWDNPDLEAETYESSKKKHRGKEDIFTDPDAPDASQEDLDGAPLDDSSQETTHHSSDSRFVL